MGSLTPYPTLCLHPGLEPAVDTEELQALSPGGRQDHEDGTLEEARDTVQIYGKAERFRLRR